MKNPISYFVIAITMLIAGLLFSVNSCIDNKKEKARVETNLSNITHENAILDLTVKEYNTIRTHDTEKIDSLLKVLKLKPKFIQGATVVNTVYKDTVIQITKITSIDTVKTYADKFKQADQSFSIKVSFDSPCWGLQGEILTTDKSAKFNVTEKKANNSVQLIVTRERRFLGLLWRTRKADFKVYSDCGTVKFTDIKFIK